MSWAIEHKGMICTVAHKVHRRALSAGARIELCDLQQDGAAIAIQAQSTFDSTRDVLPSTYLYTSLQRGLNNIADYAIYQKRFEQDGIDLPEVQQSPICDDLTVWDFTRTLSAPAQSVFTSWLQPSPLLIVEIKQRTKGRRDSLAALFHYLNEQGCDQGRLNALHCEILDKAKAYEG